MAALLRISASAGLEFRALLSGDVSGAHALTIVAGESNELLPRHHKRASARKIDVEKVNAQLDGLILNCSGLSVSEAARQPKMHPKQLYEIANDKAKKIAEIWMRDRKERSSRSRARAAALIEAAVLDILAEGKELTCAS